MGSKLKGMMGKDPGAIARAKRRAGESAGGGPNITLPAQGGSPTGTTVAHELIQKQGEANKLVGVGGKGDTKGSAIGAQLASTKKKKAAAGGKQKAGISVAAVDKTIIGSGGKKLGA